MVHYSVHAARTLSSPRSGIAQSDVSFAADTLLRAGERPTIERIRAEIGRGSPKEQLSRDFLTSQVTTELTTSKTQKVSKRAAPHPRKGQRSKTAKSGEKHRIKVKGNEKRHRRNK